MSAYRATSSTSPGDTTSVTTLSPVSARAVAIISGPPAETLEGVRRRARLESASAQNARTLLGHVSSRVEEHLLALDRAWPAIITTSSRRS